MFKQLKYTLFFILFLPPVFGQKTSIESLAESVVSRGEFEKMQDRHIVITDSFSNLNSYNAHYYYLDTLLHKAQRIKDQTLEGIVWIARGNFYLGTGNNFKSIDAFRKAIVLLEKNDRYSGLCNAYTNIGNTYFYMSDYEKALTYYKTAISYAKKTDESKSDREDKLANLYNNLGSVYCSIGDLVFGKTYFSLAFEIWKEKKDSISLAYAYNNFAQVFHEQKQYDSAEAYYTKALNLKLRHGSLIDKSDGYRTLAGLNYKAGKIDKALENAQKSISYLDTNIFNRQLMYCYDLLNNIYREKKDYKNELRYFRLYSLTKDSSNSREKISSLTKLEMQFEFSKIHLADSIRSVEEMKLKDLKISTKNAQSYFLVFILILTIVALSLIYSRFKLTKKQKLIIEEKNREITDSINYAKKIQQSILPSDKYFDKEIKRLNGKK